MALDDFIQITICKTESTKDHTSPMYVILQNLQKQNLPLLTFDEEGNENAQRQLVTVGGSINQI
jgi:hypothetical protein